jgi:hypothetical protein
VNVGVDVGGTVGVDVAVEVAVDVAVAVGVRVAVGLEVGVCVGVCVGVGVGVACAPSHCKLKVTVDCVGSVVDRLSMAANEPSVPGAQVSVTTLLPAASKWAGNPVTEYAAAPAPVSDEKLTSSGRFPALLTVRSRVVEVPTNTSPKSIVDCGSGVEAKRGPRPVQLTV